MRDVIALLEDLRVPYARGGEHHHVAVGWIGIDCPMCSPSAGKFKLGVNVATLATTCWTCGYVSLAQALADVSGEHVGAIRKRLGGVETRADFARREVSGKLTLPGGLGPMRAAHKRYLRDRGFVPDRLARLWKLQGIGPAARLAWRVFIPIHYRGELVSWTTRAIGSADKAKYVNAKPEEEAVSAKSLLFGDDFVRHAVVVTEGPFDAMAIGPGAVATLGVNVTPAQLAKLSRYPVRVVVFDSEGDAQRRARQLCEQLAPFAGKTLRVELDAKDPASATKSELHRLRRAFLE